MQHRLVILIVVTIVVVAAILEAGQVARADATGDASAADAGLAFAGPGMWNNTPPPIFYGQYDWPCPVALRRVQESDGSVWMLCPSGLDGSGRVRQDGFWSVAFNTPGGMDWLKLRRWAAGPGRAQHGDQADALTLGGIFWVSWAELNPAPGGYNWGIIDNYVAYARANIQVDLPDGTRAPKPVIIKIFDSLSDAPSHHYPAPGLEGGFMMDDFTPNWVKQQLVEPLPSPGMGAEPACLKDKNGVCIATRDDGSYWVRSTCDYSASAGFGASGAQGGSLFRYAYWKVPKYDKPAWYTNAKRMAADVAAHYRNSTSIAAFILGIGGVDGEAGNYLKDQFLGCADMRSRFAAQYGASAGNMLAGVIGRANDSVASAFRQQAPRLMAYVGFTGAANPSVWTNLSPAVGLHQARLTIDSPSYYKPYSNDGVYDWMRRYSDTLPIAWENAYPWADERFVYQEWLIGMSVFADWGDLMGGLWQTSHDLLRWFTTLMGRDIVTTPDVWWAANWTCYDDPTPMDCPDQPAAAGGNWRTYRGWGLDLNAGLNGAAILPRVNPWTQLTAAQRQSRYWRMLREITPDGTRDDHLPLQIDARWQGWRQTPAAAGGNAYYDVQLTYLDKGSDRLAIVYRTPDSQPAALVSPNKTDSGQFVTSTVTLCDAYWNGTLDNRGSDLWVSAHDAGSEFIHMVSVAVRNGACPGNTWQTVAPPPLPTPGVGATATPQGVPGRTPTPGAQPVATPTPPGSVPSVPWTGRYVSQPGGPAGWDDTFLVSSNPALPYGRFSVLRAGDDEGAVAYVALVKPNLLVFPAEVQVMSATLRVYQYGRGGEKTLSAFAMRRDWSELGATWDGPAEGLAWAAPGARSAADREQTPFAAVRVNGGSQWLSFDITTLLQDWLAGRRANYGVAIESSSGPYHVLQSVDWVWGTGSAFPREDTLVPYIEYVVTGPGGPAAVAPTRPATATVAATATPAQRPTRAPAATATALPQATAAPTATATATRLAASFAFPIATATPTQTATATATPLPTATPTDTAPVLP